MYSSYTKKELFTLCKENKLIPVNKISFPSDIINIYMQFLPRKYRIAEQEYFIVICLDGNNSPSHYKAISKGTADKTIVHPRDVFKFAISKNAVRIILCHNHPSGSLVPSREDNDMTKRLKQGGELLGIDIIDHIIIGPNPINFYSFRENGNIF